MSEENIEKGCINSDRTRCKCNNCEEEMDLDPSWTYESECPLCEENLFCYICYICQDWACGASDEPAFPNQPCDECGKTHEEQEEEDVNLYDHKEEKKRVAMGASFREAKTREPMPVYQNNILLTYNALYGRAKPGSSPVSESDALRMSEKDWKVLRPVIVDELEDESILTIDWCKYQINVFERSWQQDNMAGLERGTVEDRTGNPYMLFCQHNTGVQAGVRSLREVQMEEGSHPIAPIVRIDEEAWYKSCKGDLQSGEPLSNFVTWGELPDNFEEDPREIYKLDGNKTMTLFEFLIWSARCGGFAQQEPNPKWNIVEYPRSYLRGFSTIEPLGYVPCDWVGRPKTFEEDINRWHWIKTQMKSLSHADRVSLQSKVVSNMKRCSVCYGEPKHGRTELILCECGCRYFCSDFCKDEVWAIHTLDHRKHHADVNRICLGCGTKGGNELLRCGRCKNAFFCNKECQTKCWKGFGSDDGHKKQCKEYVSFGGRPGWSNIS